METKSIKCSLRITPREDSLLSGWFDSKKFKNLAEFVSKAIEYQDGGGDITVLAPLLKSPEGGSKVQRTWKALRLVRREQGERILWDSAAKERVRRLAGIAGRPTFRECIAMIETQGLVKAGYQDGEPFLKVFNIVLKRSDIYEG